MESVEAAVVALVKDIDKLAPDRRCWPPRRPRLARGLADDAPGYMRRRRLARELRATVAALVGAPSIGTGVGDREFDDLVTRLPTPRPYDWDGDQWAGAPSRPWTRTAPRKR